VFSAWFSGVVGAVGAAAPLRAGTGGAAGAARSKQALGLCLPVLAINRDPACPYQMGWGVRPVQEGGSCGSCKHLVQSQPSPLGEVLVETFVSMNQQ
jgi:hypothetical protein